TVIGDKVPFELMFGEQPDYTILRRFGSVAYSWIPHEKRKKFEPTSDEMVFVGYSSTAKAYRLLDPHSDRVVEQRNCEVWDGVYRFCDKSSPLCAEHEKCKCQKSVEPQMAPVVKSRVMIFNSETNDGLETADAPGTEFVNDDTESAVPIVLPTLPEVVQPPTYADQQTQSESTNLESTPVVPAVESASEPEDHAKT